MDPDRREENLHDLFEDYLHEARWHALTKGSDMSPELEAIMYKGGHRNVDVWGPRIIDPMKEPGFYFSDFSDIEEEDDPTADYKRKGIALRPSPEREPDYTHPVRLDKVYGFVVGCNNFCIQIHGLTATSEQGWEEESELYIRRKNAHVGKNISSWFTLGLGRDIDAFPRQLLNALIQYTNTIVYDDLSTDPMKKKISELNVILRRVTKEGVQGSNHGKKMDLVLAVINELHVMKKTNLYNVFEVGNISMDNKEHLIFTLAEALVPPSKKDAVCLGQKRPPQQSLVFTEDKRQKRE